MEGAPRKKIKFVIVSGSSSSSSSSSSDAEIIPPSIPEKSPDVEKMSILEVARKYTPKSWEDFFKNADPELELISEIVESKESSTGITCFPERKNLFRAFEITPLSKVSVVIFGQDPYHQYLDTGLPRAQGLSFSVCKEDTIPSSLQNIFKELKDDLGVDNFAHGDLSYWGYQGVLLLNTSLTVTPDNPNSHGNIWKGFVNKVIKTINEVNPHCIYVLWGKNAQGLKKYISDTSHVLMTSHPSGLSARYGFYGCKHFSQINTILTSLGRRQINWILPY